MSDGLSEPTFLVRCQQCGRLACGCTAGPAAHEGAKWTVTYSYPERYFDGEAHAFHYRQKRYEIWLENGQKMGRWEWVPATWNAS